MNDTEIRKYCLDKATALLPGYKVAPDYIPSIIDMANHFYDFMTGVKDDETRAPTPVYAGKQDIAGDSLYPARSVSVSGSYTIKDAERPEGRERDEDCEGIHDPAPCHLQDIPKSGDLCGGDKSRIRDLIPEEKALLDRLASFGPDAKAPTKSVLGDMDIAAPQAGRYLGRLEKLGYVRRLRQSPPALWVALQDSDGNPPVRRASQAADVAITRCPPGYAAGYGFKKSMYEECGALS